MRAIFDTNVVISAILSPSGPSAELMRAWLDGRFELAVSPHLLSELTRALRYPKLAQRITSAEAAELVDLLRAEVELVDDTTGASSIRSGDADDDFLIGLCEVNRIGLVTGDRKLASLSARMPVFSPRVFLDLVRRLDRGLEP